MSKSIVKLPKQWRHWCASMHLRPYGKRTEKSHWNWYYLKGRGFVWRVNCFAELERGDSYEGFDRWALCAVDAMQLPKTKATFKSAVLHLVEQAQEPKP